MPDKSKVAENVHFVQLQVNLRIKLSDHLLRTAPSKNYNWILIQHISTFLHRVSYSIINAMIEVLIGKSFIGYRLRFFRKLIQLSRSAYNTGIHYVSTSWTDDVTTCSEKGLHQMMSVKAPLKVLIFSVWLHGLAFALLQSDKVFLLLV